MRSSNTPHQELSGPAEPTLKNPRADDSILMIPIASIQVIHILAAYNAFRTAKQRMIVLAVIVLTLVFLGLSGAGALAESIAPDELSSMGVVRRPDRSDVRQDSG